MFYNFTYLIILLILHHHVNPVLFYIRFLSVVNR